MRGLLLVDPGSVADVTAFLYAVRIVVCPVHQSTEFVPFVHAANVDSIAQAHRHALREIDIVRDQERTAIPGIENKPLMPGTFVVVAEHALDEAGDLYPVACFVLR